MQGRYQKMCRCRSLPCFLLISVFRFHCSGKGYDAFKATMPQAGTARGIWVSLSFYYTGCIALPARDLALFCAHNDDLLGGCIRLGEVHILQAVFIHRMSALPVCTEVTMESNAMSCTSSSILRRSAMACAMSMSMPTILPSPPS